jgi:hypothetical protein
MLERSENYKIGIDLPRHIDGTGVCVNVVLISCMAQTEDMQMLIMVVDNDQDLLYTFYVFRY